ncbi:D-alanine--D-alanyl carrier protein ligase [Paenibacillus plantiphilus]|uniref:D-alanine--D-alanyl carrier protein ligase n=1 Tax=Paenibacillus plantiphilus TaxID=2905650 RepID=A0ABN8G6H8_9BACL|nr:amino acid adenylation domain-containing protein [Paenibacillus plantiphilus]CAH1200785.1 D-alanine--D-alanyl carrier protein ligase [Paenibacillus plantiphilus]
MNMKAESMMKHHEKEKEKQYWLHKFQNFDTPSEIPKDYPLGKFAQRSMDQSSLELSEEVSSSIIKISGGSEYALFMIASTGVKYILHRYSGNQSVTIGMPVFKQNTDKDLLINHMLPLKTEVENSDTFVDWIQRVKKELEGAVEHQNYPIHHFVQSLGLEHDPYEFPLFKVAVMLKGLHDETYIEEEPLPIIVVFEQAGNTIRISVKFNEHVYEANTIQRFLTHLENYFTEIARNRNVLLSEIDILSDDERNAVIYQFNDTGKPYFKEQTLHGLFEQQAAARPNNIALIEGDRSITYQELNERSNQAARMLRDHGVRRGVHVALLMDRSIEMIIGLFGILKAGAAYVPIEPDLPNTRIQQIFNQIQVEHVVTNVHHYTVVKRWKAAIPSLQHFFCMDGADYSENGLDHKDDFVWTQKDRDRYSKETLLDMHHSSDTAYVIFTSGSTGIPKGVTVSHQSVVNLIQWVNETYEISESDRILFIASISFDLSVYDIFGILGAGGSVRIARLEELLNPESILHILRTESITFWDSAPAAMQQLVPLMNLLGEECSDSKLRLVFFSGDWIPLTLPDNIRRLFPNARIIGLGGATEASIWSNYFEIEQIDANWISIPYGKPIQNAMYYVLDQRLRPCPIGVPGELYIAGDCVSKGYFGDVKLTESKFLHNPFMTQANNLMYRTGDLARWKADGMMEFMGRLDHQVKIRGYRIELGEIQAQLLLHEEINEVLVTDGEDAQGDKYLCAYVVSNQQLDLKEVGSFLSDRLPPYMIPSYFMQLDHLPLTMNGKVDRKNLPDPLKEQQSNKDTSEYVEPRDSLELEMVSIWKRVLEMDTVGVYDNFFESGGNSLKAVSLIAEFKASQIPGKISELMQYPTISEFAEYISKEYGFERTPLIKPSESSKSVVLGNLKVLSEVRENKNDPYTWDQLDCFYRPVAIIADSFYRGGFDSILFQLSLYTSFNPGKWRKDIFVLEATPRADFFELYDNHLKDHYNMGIHTITYTDESDMHQKIMEEIKKGRPVLIPGNHYGCYYNEGYRKTHQPHFWIIKGYDTERDLYFILDNVHIDLASSTIYKDYFAKSSDIFEMCELFYDYLQPNSTSRHFWSFEKSKRPIVLTPDKALINLYDIFRQVDAGEVGLEYLEYEVIKEILEYGDPSRCEEIVPKINFREVFYDLLFKFLDAVDIEHESVARLRKQWERANVLWSEIRMRIYDHIGEENYNFEAVMPLVHENLNNERICREAFVELMGTFIENMEQSEETDLQGGHSYIEENPNDAVISVKDNEIEFVLSSDRKYDTWIATDNCPKLLIYPEEGTDFVVETTVNIGKKLSGEFQSGIIVKLANGHKLLFGMMPRAIALFSPELADGARIHSEYYTEGMVSLQVKQQDGLIYFAMKHPEEEKWAELVGLEMTEVVSCFGIFARTYKHEELRVLFTDTHYSLDENERSL